MTSTSTSTSAGRARPTDHTVVIPTVGRPSLRATLESLAAQVAVGGIAPAEVVVVDDRPLSTHPMPLDPADLLEPGVLAELPWRLRVLRSGGRGPAAARNVGWRSVGPQGPPWVLFLDDDVVLPAGWSVRLEEDLGAASGDVGGVQGRLEVPLPDHRRPTDWERNTAGLETAAWATADMAYRREALQAVHGFDERFPRAYREDADLALRVRDRGWRLVRGLRVTTHPVRPAHDLVSLRMQAGTASDALMRALHGPRWRAAAETGRGRFRWHLATVAAVLLAVGGLVSGRGRLAALGVAGWAGLTSDFARRRIAPGPGPGQVGWAAEYRRMGLTSIAIPFAAVRHRVVGAVRYSRGVSSWPPPLRAVLFDRDGTLVHDVPYNGDPDAVRPIGGAREVLDDLRARGVAVGVVSNQSGIGRGLLTTEQVQAVDDRVERELGPFDVWQRCPHSPETGCVCRKPAPGMVLAAAEALGIAPYECAVVGDIAADVQAAVAAGARAVLVPTDATLPDEIADADLTAPTLRAAVDLLLGTTSQPGSGPGRTPASGRPQEVMV